MKHVVTNVRFDYTLTEAEFISFDHNDLIGMALDSYLDPAPHDEFAVTVHSIVETEDET